MNKRLLAIPFALLAFVFVVNNVSCGTMGNSQLPIDNSTAIFYSSNATFINYWGNGTLVFQIPFTSNYTIFTNTTSIYNYHNATLNMNFTFTNNFNDTWKLSLNGITTKPVSYPINIFGNGFQTGINFLSTNNLIFNYSDSPSNFIFSSNNLTVAKVQLVIPNGTFKIDPSFGNNATSTSAQQTIYNIIAGAKVLYLGGVNNSADSISAYLHSSAGFWNVTYAIYDNSNNLIGQTASGVWNGSLTTGWLTLNFTVKPALINNTNYYIVAWANATSTLVMYSSASGTSYWKGLTYTGIFPSNIPTFSTTSNNNPDIYCNYSSIVGYWLTTSVNVSTGTGTITPSGTNLYPNNTVVSITITPSSSYYLYDYALDGTLTYYSSSLTVTMSANHTLTAICVVGLLNYTLLSNQENIGLTNGTFTNNTFSGGGVTISNYTLLSNGTSFGLSNGTFVNNTFPIVSSYTYDATTYTVTLSNGTVLSGVYVIPTLYSYNSTDYSVTLSNGTTWSGTYIIVSGYSHDSTSYLVSLSNGTNLSDTYVIVNSYTVLSNGTDTVLSNATEWLNTFPIIISITNDTNSTYLTLSNGTILVYGSGGSNSCSTTLPFAQIEATDQTPFAVFAILFVFAVACTTISLGMFAVKSKNMAAVMVFSIMGGVTWMLLALDSFVLVPSRTIAGGLDWLLSPLMFVFMVLMFGIAAAEGMKRTKEAVDVLVD